MISFQLEIRDLLRSIFTTFFYTAHDMKRPVIWPGFAICCPYCPKALAGGLGGSDAKFIQSYIPFTRIAQSWFGSLLLLLHGACRIPPTICVRVKYEISTLTHWTNT